MKTQFANVSRLQTQPSYSKNGFGFQKLHMSLTPLIVISTIRRGVLPPCLALCCHVTSKQQLKGPAYCTSKKSELPPGTSAEQISLIKRWRDESGTAKPLPTSVSLLSPLKLQSRTRETNTIKALFLCRFLSRNWPQALSQASAARSHWNMIQKLQKQTFAACNTCL